MSTIFPGSASVGQIFDGYEFNGTAWDIIGIDLTADYLENSTASATYLTQASASTTYATKAYTDNAVASLADSAPSTLNTLNELAAALGDDANFATTITNALSPIGSVTAYALATPPAGWLLCDGSVYSASAYPTLSVGLGSTYGGNGTTTFAVPNLKGRMPVGLDSTQTEFDARGETGGVKEVTLTSAQSGLPAHSHGVSDPGHIHYQSGIGLSANGSRAGLVNPDGIGFTATGSQVTGISISNNAAANAASAHTNLQPYIVMNYIIRAV
jgi:microcystin-dependent protein